jgi:predicted transcriptional regulator YdeE
MKIVKVTYTTNTDFSELNQQNIKKVMSDLIKLKHQGINYNACLSADNKTFTHTAFFNSDEDQKILSDLPSFKYFQEQLKASGLEVPPKQELLNLVGSSSDIFLSSNK